MFPCYFASAAHQLRKWEDQRPRLNEVLWTERGKKHFLVGCIPRWFVRGSREAAIRCSTGDWQVFSVASVKTNDTPKAWLSSGDNLRKCLSRSTWDLKRDICDPCWEGLVIRSNQYPSRFSKQALDVIYQIFVLLHRPTMKFLQISSPSSSFDSSHPCY